MGLNSMSSCSNGHLLVFGARHTLSVTLAHFFLASPKYLTDKTNVKLVSFQQMNKGPVFQKYGHIVCILLSLLSYSKCLGSFVITNWFLLRK